MSFSESKKRVAKLHQELRDSKPLSETYILEQLENLHIVTSTLNAAYLLLMFIAPVCTYRPKLTSKLLPRVFSPLWMTDFKTKDVIQWIEYHLSSDKSFDELLPVEIEWIKYLLHNQDMISRILDEEEELQNRSMTQNVRDELVDITHVLLESIVFRYYWKSEMLNNYNKAILLFYVGEKPQQAFDLLTSVVAKYDMNKTIKLFIVSQPEWDDINLAVSKKFPNWFDIDETVQIVWFHRQQSIHLTRTNQINQQLYIQYTTELLTSP